MPLRFALVYLFVAPVLLVGAADARACTQTSVAESEVIASSNTLVLAQILSSTQRSPRQQGLTATMSIRVKVTQVFSGPAVVHSILVFSHNEPMPERNPGGRTYCPMWQGSGIEFRLKPGASYYLLLSGSVLMRAVPQPGATRILNTWTRIHGLDLVPSKARRASVVMRVTIERTKGGSKYHWTTVRPLRVLKNTSGQSFAAPFDIARYGASPPLRPGSYTIYLESYGQTKQWRLLDGTVAAGTSHFRAPAKRRVP